MVDLKIQKQFSPSANMNAGVDILSIYTAKFGRIRESKWRKSFKSMLTKQP